MKIFLSVFTLFCFGLSANAQHWSDKMQNPDVTNIYEIQKEFQSQFDSSLIGVKATGYKQFNRWFANMEHRCYPTGELFDPSAAWKERMQFIAKESNTSAPATWKSLGPETWTTSSYNPGLGRINVITVDPVDSNIIYVGAPAGGLWKTTDGGSSWQNLTDHLPILGASGLSIDPNNTDVLYLGTGDGDGSDTYSIGILKSIDGGLSWVPTGLNWTTNQFRVIRKVVISPASSDTLYAATSAGLYVSDDAGANWTKVANGSFRDVEVHPSNSNIVYACTDQFYKSTDAGFTFSQISSGLPSAGVVNRMSIAVSPDNAAVVYGVFGSSSDATFYGLYKSTDEGQTWTQMSNSPNIFGYSTVGGDNSGLSWYALALAVNPNDHTEIFVGGVNVWKSSDSGVNWTIESHWTWPSSIGYTHADIHTLDFYGSTLYVGSDGGIFQSPNRGGSWTDLSDGLRIMQFYRMGASESHPYIVAAGAQDNGTNVRPNDSSDANWNHIYGADGFEAVIHPTNPDIIYLETQNGGLRKTTDGGQTTNGIRGSITGSGAWNTPIVMHPTDPDILYTGFQDLWVTYDGANTWSQNPILPSIGGTINAIAVAESDPNYLYISSGSKIVMTPNDGITWNNISGGLPNNFIRYIAVHNTDPTKVWVCMSGYSNGQHVYFSDDAGSTWTNITRNLPNLPANTIVHQAGSNGALYVGTDVGVYYTNDSLGQWVDFSDQLPNVIVSELEIHYGIGKIRAATFGRGLWESDLYSRPNVGLEGYYKGDVKLYPMPVTDVVNIDLPEPALNIKVYNQLGQDVINTGEVNSLSFRLKADGLPAGNYILQIEFESGILNKELVIN